MSKTALPGPALAATDPAPAAPLATHHGLQHRIRSLLLPIASLKITVVLFALSLFLIFCGTLAQIDQGIWTVLHKYFRTFFSWIPLQIFVQFGQIFFNLPKDLRVSGSIPFPGGWAIGTLLLVNLLAAHLVRFKVTWKRSGILLIHAGLVVLMLGEFITGLCAVEARMTIAEGQTMNYVTDNRAAELAIIDTSNPHDDKVVVIPSSILRAGGRIQDERLPFDVQVNQYMVNSELLDLRDKQAAMENPANAGDGLQTVAVERPEVSGTADEIDLPAAYVTFFEKGKDRPLGTYLLSLLLSLSNQPLQTVPLPDGKQYDVGFRFKRIYKPYSLQLLEFRYDRYPGTDIPKNFSSLVRVVDPERNEDRQALIRMNEPLRHREETYYQADFDKKTEKTTVLQVVDNPGWRLPYIACTMVVVGLLIHFCLHLVRFLSLRFAQ
jgi:hypothetical protein